ncbi:extracellular ribonuclease LE-like protein [Cinnamomum micranthum f. kanehirae]|uniref:Extracellular ribonuclease LE-like protein n=1 Tax=Cinnamomum micranthum f. kanehirae TaxID=337451 RepID=A0A3S3Q2K2_9MAGN|nr:extracellular ribonuclease LE-like protein [Cinnamomum micranthum f. kanehirae]
MASCNADVLVLVTTLFFSYGVIASTNFDFFYYVLSWPGSACRARAEGCCLPTTGEPELDFFVMGLYPADSSGKILTKCNDTKFLVNALAKFIGDMYSYMPNLKCPSNNGVSSWKRRWSPYGVCSGQNETEYFRRSLLLRSTINLLPILKRRGKQDDLPHTDDEKYNTGLPQAAINDAVGNTTRVACNTKVEGGRQLSQIWMCVDRDVS